MNRRDFFIKSSALAASTALLSSTSRLFAQAAPAAGAAPATPPAPPFVPLRRGVGYFTMRGGTIGWLVDDTGVAVVDTQFPDTAARFLAELPGRNGRTVDVAVNTHYHGDHTSGNAVLKAAGKALVGHQAIPELMKIRAAADKREADPQLFPTELFAESWKQSIGDETLSARFHGPAHTRSDVIVVFENANVVHMGDLVFNRLYPVTDRPGGTSIRGWINVLETAAKTYPVDAIYVFGHGNPKFGVTGKRGDLLVFRDYLSGVLDYTEKQIAAGVPKSQVIALENLPGFADFHQPLPNRLGLNLGAAYDELTEKKS